MERVEATLTFFVKRIKGRLYVYEWVNGREKYIGSLDEIVLTYLANKAQIKVSGKITTRKLKLLAKYIAMELDNLYEKTKDQWCGGWDLNPRRPTPPGPQPGPFDQTRAPPLIWCFILFFYIILVQIFFYYYGYYVFRHAVFQLFWVIS